MQFSRKKRPFIDKILRFITVMAAIGLFMVAWKIFDTRATYLVALVIGYTVARLRPAAPFYIMLATIPVLAAMLIFEAGGETWEKLIERVAAFIMFMAIIGLYSVIIAKIRSFFVGKVELPDTSIPRERPRIKRGFSRTPPFEMQQETAQRPEFTHPTADQPDLAPSVHTHPEKAAKTYKEQPLSEYFIDLSAQKTAARSSLRNVQPNFVTKLEPKNTPEPPKPKNVTHLTPVYNKDEELVNHTDLRGMEKGSTAYDQDGLISR